MYENPNGRPRTGTSEINLDMSVKSAMTRTREMPLNKGEKMVEASGSEAREGMEWEDLIGVEAGEG
jgi:hypothetical protein